MPDINVTKRGNYEVIKEGNQDVLKINYQNYPYIPSIENNPLCMAEVVDKLVAVPSTSKIIFTQRRNYAYNYEQIQLLLGVAALYHNLIRQRDIYSFGGMGSAPVECTKCYGNRYANVQYIINNLLKSDPLGAYVETKRLLREEKIKAEKERLPRCKTCKNLFVNLLKNLHEEMDQLAIVERAKPYLDGFVIGDREVYKLLFRPTISPDFMFTKLMAKPPLHGEELDTYRLPDGTVVSIYKLPNNIKYLYHIIPPEFKLSEDKYMLLDLAKNVLAEHKPTQEEFINPQRMRQTFLNIGMDLLQELSHHQNIKLKPEEIKEMANILVRYTVGFGLIEILLQDQKVQDISVNGPIGQTPIFIIHQDYDDCVTNIHPAYEDGESWATKFRMLSGRPLDEANPVLDTELLIPGARARVAVVGFPLNPLGLAYAFRRHRDKPWTFPLFMQNKMINPMFSGLMSFLIDGARTILVAGTRSSGKTSLLGSVLVELMRKYRVITVEDTLELPTEALRNLGYNIQPMKVQAVIGGGGRLELSAEEGIRTSLRLGDSSLIVGEVRSTEAKALYEAMRVGALANVVAGTIHGDSPYGVFDRVVNDLEVPRTSFKATDIIVIANPIKSSDGLHRWRRVTQVTEVKKHWEDDPLREQGFVDLMKYDSKKDELVPTDNLINGDSEILKSIAGNVKDWVGNWDAVWDNIMLRANIKKSFVDNVLKAKALELLEAKFVIDSNDEFHKISNSVKEDVGTLDSKRIQYEWEDWLKKQIREYKKI